MKQKLFNVLEGRFPPVTPPFHARIELCETAGGWLYGVEIRLINSFWKSPVPGESSAPPAARRRVPGEEIAVVFALHDICKKTPRADGDSLDENAVAGALCDEAARLLEIYADEIFLKYRARILADEVLRVRLSYVLPKRLLPMLKMPELYSFESRTTGSGKTADTVGQLCLF